MRLTRLQAVNRVLLVHDVERYEKLLHSRLAFAIAEAEHRKLRFGLQRQRACQRTFEHSQYQELWSSDNVIVNNHEGGVIRFSGVASDALTPMSSIRKGFGRMQWS